MDKLFIMKELGAIEYKVDEYENYDEDKLLNELEYLVNNYFDDDLKKDCLKLINQAHKVYRMYVNDEIDDICDGFYAPIYEIISNFEKLLNDDEMDKEIDSYYWAKQMIEENAILRTKLFKQKYNVK